MKENGCWMGAVAQAHWNGADWIGTVSEIDESLLVLTSTDWGEPTTRAEIELRLVTDYESARVGARFEGAETSKCSPDPSARDLIFTLVYVNVEASNVPRVVLPFSPGTVLLGGIPIACSLIEASEGYVEVITDFELEAGDATEVATRTHQGDVKLVGKVKFSGEEPGTGGKYKSRIECAGATRVDGIRWAHYWKQKAA